MTDDELLIQQFRIDDLAAKWLTPLGLDRWERVDFSCVRGSSDYPGAAGWCTADWKYLEAAISFNAEMIESMTDSYLEHIFLHECAHVLISEISFDDDDAADHEERVATELAQVFRRIHSRGESSARN